MCRPLHRTAALVAGLGLAACGPPAPFEIDLSTEGDAVAAVVFLDAEGLPVRTLPAFGLDDGRLAFGTRPQEKLQGEEDRIAWVVVPRTLLDERFPGAWAARETFQLAAGVPPSSPRAEPSPDRLRWRWRMPLLPEVEVRGDELGRARAGLTLLFEQEAEPCRDPDRGSLVPYADRAAPVEAAGAGRLRSLAVLDPARVVVGGRGLFVLERGRPFGGVSLAPEVLMHPNAEVFALAADPRTLGAAETRLYAALYVAEGGPPRSALVEVRLDATGLHFVRTATVVQAELRALDVGPRGEVATSADSGVVVLTGPDGQGLFRQDIESAPRLPGRARALAFTTFPEEPLLVTSTSRLHARTPEGGDWRQYLLNRFRATIEIQGLAVDGEEAWIGGSDNALIHRRSLNDFQQIVLTYPPRLGQCSDGSEGMPPLTTSLDIGSIALLDRDPILSYQRCTTLFRVRRSDGCVSSIPVEGEPELSNFPISSVRTIGELIIVTDQAGRVLVSAPRGG